MSILKLFQGRLRLPAIVAPMFLVNGPELVIAACKAGVAASFPSLNARNGDVLAQWLGQIGAALESGDGKQAYAPFGINLILHKSNPRCDDDIAAAVAHKVPFLITSLGNPAKVVDAVRSYGGVVFSDVINATHARKAIEAGVDGLIAVGSGAGGHAGTQSLFSLAREIRQFWDGPLVLGGAISDGAGIRAVEVLGADMAYIGTRFLATQESMAPADCKQMIVDSSADDVAYTDAVSGTHANMLRKSLQGVYGDDWEAKARERRADGPKAWRDVWSAGHGVATIHDIPTVAELVGRLRDEYLAACQLPPNPALY